ncbi:copper amine oxidase N-terminal domain-containing protein [Paenibacillus wulumuqiensis]|uniref:copper amine oxidase N-terminal domain-containing protein n=1 Tax=Paenibacillus wulumuqiensis TaxID=1567107 RepID=UPI000695B15A|nr:copper amine oxidase N-terminal domain-containing protein [Paenibacillus wulumuqiensis]
MKKQISSALLAAALVVSGGVHTPSADAAAPIKITVNGVPLVTDQAPVMSGSRTMVPLRGVFEALNAKVLWKQSTKTVTAVKGATTVVLPVGSTRATINDKLTAMDVPAKVIKGRVMVPLRFVTEAMGSKVGWNKATQTVSITTNTPTKTTPVTPAPSTGSVSPVSYVNASVIGQQGNGSDLQIAFPASASVSAVSQYRILVVKSTNMNSFSLASAQAVPAANYQVVPKGSSNYTITLLPQSRDTDGALIQKNVGYRVYVLAVGNPGYTSALTMAQTVTNLGSTVSASATPGDVKASDVADNGDGRDLSVSFSKVSDESKVSSYRIFVVPSSSASSFNVSEAGKVNSDNYTSVSKDGSNHTVRLKSTARDTNGKLLTEGVSYTVFVTAVSSSGDTLGLSAASGSLTLGKGVDAPSITKVSDVGNNGDARDLQVSFDKIANESRISGYRVFVVRSTNSGDFDLEKASALNSNRYMDVSKTGSDREVTLSASLKDNNGDNIKNDVSYRVFVMSRGTGSYSNSLSSASSTITLSSSSKTVGSTNGVSASDVSDYGDGRDLQVSFNKAGDENLVSQYRILVVKAGDSSNFTLTKAQKVSSSNYTSVSKNGSNRTAVLSSGSRDVDGDLIKNGVGYRVFVLSVGSGDASDSYSLSSASSTITLGGSTAASVVNNVTTSNSGANSNPSDVTVSFTPANDTGISEYRMIVVRNDQSSGFNLSTANSVSSSNYTRIAKTASKVTQALPVGTKDYNGNAIDKNVSYRVFVLTVADGSVRSANALSGASNEFVIANKTVTAPTNVNAAADNNAGAIRVTFTRPSDSSAIGSYSIMLVPSANADSFTLADANRLSGSRYQTVTGSTYSEWAFSTANVDVNGASIRPGVAYKAFVLSVANGRDATVNALSAASREAQLNIQ